MCNLHVSLSSFYKICSHFPPKYTYFFPRVLTVPPKCSHFPPKYKHFPPKCTYFSRKCSHFPEKCAGTKKCRRIWGEANLTRRPKSQSPGPCCRWWSYFYYYFHKKNNVILCLKVDEELNLGRCGIRILFGLVDDIVVGNLRTYAHRFSQQDGIRF